VTAIIPPDKYRFDLRDIEVRKRKLKKRSTFKDEVKNKINPKKIHKGLL